MNESIITIVATATKEIVKAITTTVSEDLAHQTFGVLLDNSWNPNK